MIIESLKWYFFCNFSRLFLGGKYETMLVDNAYKVAMKLLVKSVGPSDFGSYKCVGKSNNNTKC